MNLLPMKSAATLMLFYCCILLHKEEGAVNCFNLALTAYSNRLSYRSPPAGFFARKRSNGSESQTFSEFKPVQSSSSDSNDEKSTASEVFWQPERIIASLFKNLWKGVTIPFPKLKETLRQGGKEGVTIGLRLRECIAFLVSYFTAGVVAYSFLFEKWSIIDSLYFTSVCFSTVGYGDLCPTTAAGRIFTSFFGLTGIAFLGAAVAAICSSLLQAEVEALEKVERVGKRRILNLFRDMPITLANFKNSNGQTQQKILEKVGKKQKNQPEKWASKNWSSLAYLSQFKSFIPSVLIILVGGTIMGRLNGQWTVLESMYYSIITASTIGFGDFSPQTPRARMFAILFVPIAVGAAGELLSSVASALVKNRQKRAYEKFQADLTIEHLRALDTDGTEKSTSISC